MLGALLLGNAAFAAPAVMDTDFRTVYPLTAPSATTPIAGVQLAKLGIPGLQVTARSEHAADDGGVVLSLADHEGAVQVLVHLAVLYWPRTPSTGGLPIDKVVHAAVFGMVLWVAAQAGLRVAPVAGLLAGHAVASELIQHYLLAGRSGDPADSVADLAGVAIVTLFLWRRR
jgi:hypothetical protein